MPWALFKERIHQAIADVLFPEANACHLCGRFPEHAAILCDRCLDKLGKSRLQQRHIASSQPHPPLRVCLSAYPHRAGARELVHLLKFRSDHAVTELLAEGMTAALAASPCRLPVIDAVIPVPLHASRLAQRGYNQALWLSEALCAHTGLALAEGALIRLRATGTQVHRSRAERIEAMQHAFAVADPTAVRGRHILLVDDVLTTGATAMSCADALMQAGAASVSLLTACRA